MYIDELLLHVAFGNKFRKVSDRCLYPVAWFELGDQAGNPSTGGGLYWFRPIRANLKVSAPIPNEPCRVEPQSRRQSLERSVVIALVNEMKNKSSEIHALDNDLPGDRTVGVRSVGELDEDFL